MNNWSVGLKELPLDWLLQPENPSVRYFTLVDLLDKPETNAEVLAAKAEIMRHGLVPETLAKQRHEDYQDGIKRFYHTKYWGLVWQMMVLTELGATPNEQITKQCEVLFSNSQAPHGGFATETATSTGGGRAGSVIPCLTGNMVWSLIQFGYLDDPRLQRGIAWLTEHVHLNDGIDKDPANPRFLSKDACWGRHTCFMGAIKPLKALAAIPCDRRSTAVREAINSTAEFFLMHHVYKQSRNLSKVSKPGWMKFAFPLMYQTDTLEILDILTGLGLRDERMVDAIAFVRSQQTEKGVWKAENVTNNQKLLIPFPAEARHKWTTLRALRVLKRWHAAHES